MFVLRAQMACHGSQFARGESASVKKMPLGGLLTALKARSVGALDWQVPLTEKFCYTGAVVGMRLNGLICAPLKAQPATSVELGVRYWTVEDRGAACAVCLLLAP